MRDACRRPNIGDRAYVRWVDIVKRGFKGIDSSKQPYGGFHIDSLRTKAMRKALPTRTVARKPSIVAQSLSSAFAERGIAYKIPHAHEPIESTMRGDHVIDLRQDRLPNSQRRG
jgi:hypothetical protein